MRGSEEDVGKLTEDASRMQIIDTRPQDGQGESEYLCYFMHRFLSFRYLFCQFSRARTRMMMAC